MLQYSLSNHQSYSYKVYHIAYVRAEHGTPQDCHHQDTFTNTVHVFYIDSVCLTEDLNGTTLQCIADTSRCIQVRITMDSPSCQSIQTMQIVLYN